jgi:hypothetical protein
VCLGKPGTLDGNAEGDWRCLLGLESPAAPSPALRRLRARAEQHQLFDQGFCFPRVRMVLAEERETAVESFLGGCKRVGEFAVPAEMLRKLVVRCAYQPTRRGVAPQ